MTLIVTALADDAIVQASDRRLTINGRLYDDHANKAICASCADAHFSVAYTGVGKLAGRRTDIWAAEILARITRDNITFPKLLKDFRDEAVSALLALEHIGDQRATAFVFAGYCRIGPFAVLLSNFEDGFGQRLPRVTNGMNHRWFYRKDRTPARKLDLIFLGVDDVVQPVLGQAIKLVRRRYLERLPESRATMLVRLIRIAAKDKHLGHLIGNNCLSVIVRPSGPFAATFHLDSRKAVMSPLHFIRQGVWKQVAAPDS